MRLTFVLPRPRRLPIGGYRVHFEYANRLAARGHTVAIVFYIDSLRQRFGFRRRGVGRTLREVLAWFEFDSRVALGISAGRSIPQCDVAIVTAWTTAELAPDLRRRVRRVAQIAYDYEFWRTGDEGTRERMAAAFAQPDIVIATSGAVETMLREAGREPDATITSGLDPTRFHISSDPALREPVVGFLARPGPIKRCEDAVMALSMLRERHELRVIASGSERLDLPSWIEPHDAPSDSAMCSFYNQLAVFVLPSLYEGWGLPAAEAMACGAAVVSTRNGGVEDFARHGVNALLVPPRSPNALADACEFLLVNDSIRRRIAAAGSETARSMEWDRSVRALETVLEHLA